jgi:hypothetical protein
VALAVLIRISAAAIRSTPPPTHAPEKGPSHPYHHITVRGEIYLRGKNFRWRQQSSVPWMTARHGHRQFSIALKLSCKYLYARKWIMREERQNSTYSIQNMLEINIKLLTGDRNSEVVNTCKPRIFLLKAALPRAGSSISMNFATSFKLSKSKPAQKFFPRPLISTCDTSVLSPTH